MKGLCVFVSMHVHMCTYAYVHGGSICVCSQCIHMGLCACTHTYVCVCYKDMHACVHVFAHAC